MIRSAFLAARCFLRAVLLAVFVVLSAGLAVAVPGLGEGWFALAVGVANGMFWWYCAVYGPPSWADGQR